MKLVLALVTAIGLGIAHPALEDRDFQTVHLILHGGPASYNLTFPADGLPHATNNDLSISIIDAPDYDAYSACSFETPGDKALASSLSNDNPPNGQVLIGPPQPVISVTCTGTCIPTYGECYGTDGQYKGPCCNGYCAADRCRPWTIS